MNDKQSKKEAKGNNYQSINSKGRRSSEFNRRGNKPTAAGYQNRSGRQEFKITNDPSWYAINDTIGKAVGSIPYNRFPGTRYVLGANSQSVDQGITIKFEETASSVPGVLTIDYIPGPGVSNGATSPINIASKSVFSFIRKANSGSANYESSDLTIYMMAMDDIYSSYLELKRVYGLAAQYYYVNRNVPDLIIQALGFDPEDLRNNLAVYRARLNLIAAKISSLAVPDVLDVMKRHAFMTAAIYTDSATLMGQFYAFRKLGYYKFIFEGATGGYLQFTPYTSLNTNSLWRRRFSDSLDIVEQQIDTLIADQDMNIMSGDILKAFGESGCYRLAGVDENATTPILFDENILSQIHNSVSYNGNFSNSDFDLTQDGNVLYYKGPAVTGAATLNTIASKMMLNVLKGDLFFNSHKDNPDWKDTLEWTRLMMTVGDYIPETDTYRLSFGTEFVVDYSLFYYDALTDGVTLAPALLRFDSIEIFNNVDSVDADIINRISLLSQFDWHPIRYFSWMEQNQDSMTLTVKSIKVWGDLKHYTLLSPNMIQNLHDAAVMGEFAFNLKA